MELKDVRIGFVGFGNMAMAIAKGLVRKGMPADNLTACAMNWDKLKMNAEEIGVRPCRDPYEAVYYSDFGIVAVKPDQVEQAIEDYKDVFREKALMSVVAGLDYNWYEDFLEPDTQHLSILPNTAVEVGKGVILKEDKSSLKGEVAKKVDLVLNSLGMVETLETSLLNIGSGIAGCGGAFMYMLMESMADAGVRHGLKRDLAYKLAAQTFVGAGSMLLDTKKHPAALKDAICSPGGTTIKGVLAGEEHGLRNSIIKALEATL